MHDHFELAVYEALEPLGGVFGCGPLYHRDPVRCDDGILLTPNQGRRLFLFEKADGDMYHYGRWRALDERQKVSSCGSQSLLCQDSELTNLRSAFCFDQPVSQLHCSDFASQRSFVPTRRGNASLANQLNLVLCP